MDRLSAVTTACVALAACNDDTAKPIASRTDSAKVGKQTGATTESFCDVHFTADKAPAFPWPAMDGPTPATTRRWKWINVWASWCKPCVEETPRLVRWHDRLKLDLAFISIDENASDYTEFRKVHADWPASLRLSDPRSQQAWFKSIGIDAGAPIPVHVFVDPNGKTRCVRSGEVQDKDLAVIERLVAE